MADVFISYSRKDREQVRRLATALEQEGYSVWWDPDIIPGDQFRAAIQKELRDCTVAIVVWSEHSINSTWVMDEASEAADLKKLIPIVFEQGVDIPIGFRSLQTHDLSGWRGGTGAPEFHQLIQGITSIEQGQPIPLKVWNPGLPIDDQRVAAIQDNVSAFFSQFRFNIGGISFGRFFLGGLAMLLGFAGIRLLGMQLAVREVTLEEAFSLFFWFYLWILAIRSGFVFIKASKGRRSRAFFDPDFSRWILLSLALSLLVIAFLIASMGAGLVKLIADIPLFALMILSIIIGVRIFVTVLRLLLTRV